jgi:septum formation protein
VRIVLASASAFRAGLLREAGIQVVVDPADVDERALDELFWRRGPEVLAVELARRKAAVVAARHRDAWVIGADQVGVVGEGRAARLMVKRSTADSAVEQLMELSGGQHRLVNGVVVMAAPDGPAVEGIDEQVVRMRAFPEASARRYVERFRPFDSVGCYRLEDEIATTPGERLVERIAGEHDSGVIGLPLPLLWRLFDHLAELIPSDEAG